MSQKRTRLRTLKTFRDEQEPPLSQAQAARRFGISQASWSRWERGQYRPNRDMAKALMKVTGVPLDVLMGIAS